MTFCLNLRRFALCALLAGLPGGCASVPPPEDAPREIVVADGGRPITSAELDELTRALADRYVGLLSSACDAVHRDNPDAAQRREARVLLAECATNMYDIASNADAFTRLLDMVVVTRLTNQVWGDDHRAVEVFGGRAGPLTDALMHAQTETRALAERVLTTKQLAALDSLLGEWKAENPGMVSASFVRFSNFAIGRGRSAASEVLAARGLFAEIGQAGQAVDEARLLGERMFYQLKREATLLRWQFAAARDELFASPEAAGALRDVHRVADGVEALPATIAAEREALVSDLDGALSRADATLGNAKELIAEVRDLAAAVEPASRSLDELLGTANTLFTRFDEWHRWSLGARHRPFDIREYIEIVRESAATSERLTELLEASVGVFASPAEGGGPVEGWNRSADGRIALIADRSRLLMDAFFRRVYLAIGLLFLVLVCYRLLWLFGRPVRGASAG